MGSRYRKHLKDKAFKELAWAQRGKPESAMLRVQETLGGGVLSHAVEHTGDLTHRMSQWGIGGRARQMGYGREYVVPKVNSVLRSLTNPYGFEREHMENLISNARFRGEDVGDLHTKAISTLNKYAEEHRRLPVYNKPQRLARDAAVALGERRFGDATKMLMELRELAMDKKTWRRAMEASRPARKSLEKAPVIGRVIKVINTVDKLPKVN